MFQLPVLYLKLSRPFFNIPKLAKLKKDGLTCTQADKLIVICRWNCPLIDSFSHVGQIRELGSTPNSFAIQTHSAAQQPRRTGNKRIEVYFNIDQSKMKGRYIITIQSKLHTAYLLCERSTVTWMCRHQIEPSVVSR